MRVDTYCRPIWTPWRRKPVYVVLASMPNALPWGGWPRCNYHSGVPVSLMIPTDRVIRAGAIINPTRELKRYLNER